MSENQKSNVDDVNSDIIKYLPFKFFPGLAGLATIFFLTKSFTPENYGLYSYLVSSVLIFIQLCSSWVVNAVLYIFPEYKQEDHSRLEYVVELLQLAVVFLLGLILFFLIYNFTHSCYLAVLSVLLLTVQSFTNLYNGFLQSNRVIMTQLKASVIQSISQILLMCVLVYLLKNEVPVAVLSLIVSFFIALMILRFSQKKHNGIHTTIPAKVIIYKIIHFGIPMGAWFFFYQLIISGDRWVMKYYNLTNELGQYSSFKDLMVGISGFLTMPILLASHPIIMSKWKNGGTANRAEIELIIKKNISIILLLFVPVIMLFLLVGDQLIKLLLNEQYVLANAVMVAILISVLMASINLYVQKGLEITGKTIKLAIIALIASLIGMGLNIFLTPLYKLLSIVIVSIAIQVLYALIVFQYTKHIIRFSFSIKNLLHLACWAVFVVALFYGINSFDTLGSNYSLSLFLAGFFISLLILYYNATELRSFIDVIYSLKRKKK